MRGGWIILIILDCYVILNAHNDMVSNILN
jgi:hypothetical protein